MVQQIPSVEWQNVEQSDLMRILQGLYGPIHSKLYRRSRQRNKLIELGEQNHLQQSLFIFKENYEQLQTFEYYLLVNIYCQIIETCTTKEDLDPKR